MLHWRLSNSHLKCSFCFSFLQVSDTEAIRKLLEETAAVAPDVQDSPVDLMDLPEQLPRSRGSQDYSCVLVEVRIIYQYHIKSFSDISNF